MVREGFDLRPCRSRFRRFNSLFSLFIKCLDTSQLNFKSNWLLIKRILAQLVVVVVVCKGIHFWSGTNRTGAEGLSFYYPKLLYCLDQMLAVMLLSQHRVSSSKTVRTRAPCGARFIGHAVRTWSAVCSAALQS